jgi:hypothetical protein
MKLVSRIIWTGLSLTLGLYGGTCGSYAQAGGPIQQDQQYQQLVPEIDDSSNDQASLETSPKKKHKLTPLEKLEQKWREQGAQPYAITEPTRYHEFVDSTRNRKKPRNYPEAQAPQFESRPTTYAPNGRGGYTVVGPDGSVGTMTPNKGGGFNVLGTSGGGGGMFVRPKPGGGFSAFGTGQSSPTFMTPNGASGYNLWGADGTVGTMNARPDGGYNVTGTDGSFQTIMPGPGGKPYIFGK